MKFRSRVVFVLVLLVGWALAEGFQVIYLANGTSVRGIVAREGVDTLYVETGYGRLGIPKARVLGMDYVQDTGQFSLGPRVGGLDCGNSCSPKPKNTCLGCLFCWLVPGAGMLYAEQYAGAAGYFLFCTPLTVWYAIEAKSDRGDRSHPPILAILVPIRILECIHTYVAVQSYNETHGWAFNWNKHQHTAGLEYRFGPIGTDMQPALALDFSADRPEVKAGVKLWFQ